MRPLDFDREYERFATHYFQMSDDELLQLAIRPFDLSDAAWEALEDELERRNIEIPEPESVPRIVSPEKRDLVLLRRFRDIPEALIAKGRLDSFGIECHLADDNLVRMDWFISNLLGGVKLLVEPDDFSRASRILNEPLQDEFDSES